MRRTHVNHSGVGKGHALRMSSGTHTHLQKALLVCRPQKRLEGGINAGGRIHCEGQANVSLNPWTAWRTPTSTAHNCSWK